MVKSLSLNLKSFYLLKKCIKFWLEKMYGSRDKNVRIKGKKMYGSRNLGPFLPENYTLHFFNISIKWLEYIALFIHF